MIQHVQACEGGAAHGPIACRPNRPGLPTQESVVLEFTLTPRARGRPAARARTPTVSSGPPRWTSTTRRVVGAVVAAVRRRPGENFRGTARRVAKLSIADAAFEAFDDLQDLITSVPNEEAMTAHGLHWGGQHIESRGGGAADSASPRFPVPPAARMTMTSTSSWGAPPPCHRST